MNATCPYHGLHNGRAGCPTCIRLELAREQLRDAPVRSQPKWARAFLSLMGERRADQIGSRT